VGNNRADSAAIVASSAAHAGADNTVTASAVVESNARITSCG